MSGWSRFTVRLRDVALAGAAGTLIGVACTSGPDKVVSSGLMSIVVTPDTANLIVGGTQTFAVQFLTASGNPISGINVVWSSANSTIASVDSATGVVTGANAGTVQIAASAQGVNGYATVNVAVAPVASVSISPHPDTLALNGSGTLTATLKDAHGDTLVGRTVTWSSSNSSVATVGSSTGQTQAVTAKGVGTTTITATSSNGIVGTDSVIVVDPINYILVTPNPLSVRVTHQTHAHAQAYDASNVLLTGITFTWTTKSGGSIASVSSSGVVTGVASGSDSVYASAQGRHGGSLVTVLADSVASITISPSSDTIYASPPNNTAPLTATQQDATGAATSDALTWSSSSAVATASGSASSGTVTGANTAAGTTTITAKAANGVQGQSTVVVMGHVATVVVTAPGHLTTGGPHSTGTASAALTDTFGNDVTAQRAVTWTTSDSTTLTINGSPNSSVTASPGAAVNLAVIGLNSALVTLTATSPDGIPGSKTISIGF